MRHADHAPARPETEPARPSPSGTRPSPVVAFVVALALALVGWGLFWLSSRGDPPADPGAGGGPGPSEGIRLTDAEAIDRFTDLNQLVIHGIKQRNPSLISRAHTPNSPAARRAYEDIRTLKNDDVYEMSTVRTLRAEIVINSQDEIRVQETRTVELCYQSEDGKDVTRGPEKIRQVTVWILKWSKDQWLIQDAVAKDEEVVDNSAARCS